MSTSGRLSIHGREDPRSRTLRNAADTSDITKRHSQDTQANRIVTFNGNNYDLPMISLALTGAQHAELKAASDKIIMDGLKPWHIAAAYEVPQINLPHHIDLIEVAPGVASLKIYAGRLHAPVIQDLPFDPTLRLATTLTSC